MDNNTIISLLKDNDCLCPEIVFVKFPKNFSKGNRYKFSHFHFSKSTALGTRIYNISDTLKLFFDTDNNPNFNDIEIAKKTLTKAGYKFVSFDDKIFGFEYLTFQSNIKDVDSLNKFTLVIDGKTLLIEKSYA